MTMRFLLLSLLILSTVAVGGTRVTPNTGSNMSILTSSNTGYLSDTNYWKQGDTVTSYIERLGRHTPVGVTPSRGVPTSRIAGAAKDVLRLTPGAVATSLAMMAVIETAGWAIDELTGQVTTSERSVLPVDPSFFHWKYTGNNTGPSFATPSEAASAYVATFNYSCCTYSYNNDAVSISDTQQRFTYTQTRKSNGEQTVFTYYVNRYGSGCPADYSYDSASAACVTTTSRPVTASDIDSLQISGDASFYDGLMRDACNLSSAPSRCFDDLVEQRQLSGPATVQGSKTTTTSYQTNADGTTSTVQKETQTQYDIEYGDDHYVYTPKTTTETKVDGQTTETTTEQEDTAEDSEQKPEEEEVVSEIAGLQCEATVACSGDAIQCAIASTQKDTKCILEELATIEETEVRQQVQQDFSGSDYQPFGEGESISTDLSSLIDTSSTIAASCPVFPVLSFEFNGQTQTFDFSDWLAVLCEFAGWFGAILVIFSMRNGVEVIARGFG